MRMQRPQMPRLLYCSRAVLMSSEPRVLLRFLQSLVVFRLHPYCQFRLISLRSYPCCHCSQGERQGRGWPE